MCLHAHARWFFFFLVVTVAASLQSHLTMTVLHRTTEQCVLQPSLFCLSHPAQDPPSAPPPQFGHQLISPCCIFAPSPRTSIRDWLTSHLLKATRRHRNYLIENINLYPELPPQDDSVFRFTPRCFVFPSFKSFSNSIQTRHKT